MVVKIGALNMFLIILVLLGPPVCSAQHDLPAASQQEAASRGYPVVLGKHTLFTITEDVKGYSPEERANAMSARIKQIADNTGISLSSINSFDFDLPISTISAGSDLLAAFSDLDAKAVGLTREELAAKYAEKIRIAMEAYRKERSLRNIVFGIIYSVTATAALVLITVLLKKLNRKIDGLIQTRVQPRIRPVQIQSFELLRGEQLMVGLSGALKFFRFSIFLLVFYVYVQLVLSFFPWTRPVANEILDYLMTPLGTIGRAVITCVPDLLFIAILVFIAKHLLRIMKFFFAEVEKERVRISGFYPEWAKPTYKILSLLLVAFFAAIAFPFIPGSSSSAFKGVSIFLGVLFSLGSQSAVSNIIAGFVLTYRRAFRVGDRVKVADFTGDVVEIRLQVTSLLTDKNEEVVIPNAVILNSSVINYSTRAKDGGLILHTSVTIGYDTPWRKVHELLLCAAERTSGLLREPAPFVNQQSLDDFYVTYQVNAYTDNPRRMVQIYSELHQNIQETFNEAGVEIMSPHYTQIRDGNRVTIPASYRPPDHAPSDFRIVQVDGASKKDQQEEDGKSSK